MFGEFEDFDTKNGTSTDEPTDTNCETQAINNGMEVDSLPTETSNLSSKERIALHIARTDAVLKSQQRHEPDLSFEERRQLALEILESKPGNFLYRYGKYLLQEHLHYFYSYVDDPEVNYYLKELQKSLNVHTARIQKRNRRFTALQKLRKSGSYFSEVEMKSREPLLYDQLIGRNLTTEERMEQSVLAIPSNCSFSELLLHHLDNEEEEARKGMLREGEDDTFQEEEDDDEEEEENLRDEQRDDDAGAKEEIATGRDKVLLREEFYSAMYSNFIRGQDKEFDYSQIDASEEYDMLDTRSRDEEENYFNEEDSDDDNNLTLNSLKLSTDSKRDIT